MGVSINDVLAVLDLPPAIKIQILKVLACITQAASPDELLQANDRAAGFVLKLKAIEALDAASSEALHEVLANGATARWQEDKK